MIELQKGIPLIDQHDENGYWGGKFGGNQIAESLNHPIEELTREFEKLRNDKTFIAERDFYFKNFIGAPTPFIKLENLLITLVVRKFIVSLSQKLPVAHIKHITQ